MNPNPKSTKEAMPGASVAEKPEAAMGGFPTEVATLYAKAVERAAQAQRTVLDFSVQQGLEAVDLMKKSMPAMPGMFVFDMAGQALEQFAETQKKVLELFVEQSTAVVEYSKQRGDNFARVATGVGSLLQQSLERNVGAQKTVLNFAAEQSRLMSETLKKQAGAYGVPATAMAAADSVQRGMDALIDTQKELLEIAAKPLRSVAKA